VSEDECAGGLGSLDSGSDASLEEADTASVPPPKSLLLEEQEKMPELTRKLNEEHRQKMAKRKVEEAAKQAKEEPAKQKQRNHQGM
jgi:hypothetical protein